MTVRNGSVTSLATPLQIQRAVMSLAKSRVLKTQFSHLVKVAQSADFSRKSKQTVSKEEDYLRMPPRGRSRKRNTRMDAALEAMRPYGFVDKDIRAAVNDLLKNVYGGDEGWFFIEDASYSVLIDTLVEVSKKKDASQDNAVAETSAAGPSDEVVHEDVINTLHDIAMDPAPCTDEAFNSSVQMGDSETNANDSGGSKHLGNALIDPSIPMDTHSSQDDPRGIYDTKTAAVGPSGKVASPICSEIVHEANIDMVRAPCSDEALNSTAPMGDTGVKGCNIPAAAEGEKRVVSEHIKLERNSSLMCKPCHGWISDDDLDDLVDILPRAPLPEVLENLLSKMNETKKRKTRWDV